jgi:chromosome segregation ATPase
MERTKEELEQLANDVIALNTPDKQPAASDLSESTGYKYAVATYVVTGLLEMRDNLKSKRNWREVDDLNDLIDRMHKEVKRAGLDNAGEANALSAPSGSDAEMLKAAGYVLQEAVERLMAAVDERDRYKAALEEIAGNESGINAECADGIAITALAFENRENTHRE